MGAKASTVRCATAPPPATLESPVRPTPIPSSADGCLKKEPKEDLPKHVDDGMEQVEACPKVASEGRKQLPE
jgi:hypothetical protein